MSWQDQLSGDSLSWLLEHESPGVRYLALRDLVDDPAGEDDLHQAHLLAHTRGPIAQILDEMNKRGYWVEAGPGYYPKYRGTVWSLITLAQLGAHASLDERINKACAFVVEHALTEGGQFSISGTPGGTADCLQGNLCATMLELGYDDPRLEQAFAWMSRTVTGDGIAPMTERQAPVRYYAGKCGPDFCCGANNKLPCAWGAVKVMWALSKVPADQRTPLMKRAIERGIAFLLGTDPADSDYPTGYSNKPSGNWWKFGFPLFYVTDLLQNVQVLVDLGCAHDPRLENALEAIRAKQDDDGRWPLEYSYAGKTWVEFGAEEGAE